MSAPLSNQDDLTIEQDISTLTISDDPLLGRVFSGKYEITAQIGAGGMGMVYLATQRGLGREVVIKVLKHEIAQDPSTIQRFEREAQTLSQLNHNHIVNVYDFGQEGPLSYIVMEHIKGISLSQLISQCGKLSIDLFMVIAQQLLSALHDAHEQGIVHRDIKPSNIMLTSRKDMPYYVKILDFGLVKLINEESDLTGHDKLLGTISYLAPEQILGKEVDQRADVYALGVLFYQLLSGQKPFTGRDIAVLHKHLNQAPAPLNELLSPEDQVGDALVRLIHQCLSKSPTDRPRHAGKLAQALEEATRNHDPSKPQFTAIPYQPQHPTLEVVPLSKDLTLDQTWLRQQQRKNPEQLQDTIDYFIGQLPQLLCSLDVELEARAYLLQHIEQIADTLGARNLARVAQMYKLMAQQDLIPPEQQLCQELETEYTLAFRAILEMTPQLG